MRLSNDLKGFNYVPLLSVLCYIASSDLKLG